MADLYTEHNAYGAANRLGIDNPAWGVPQEGDGSAKYPSPSSAVASVLLNAIPTAGDTVTIAGVPFAAQAAAPAAGAAAFQIGATIQITANNLAAAIRGCTATTLSATLVNGAPQLRNVLYARASDTNAGTAANTVEIMCRIGTGRFNYNAASNTAPMITSNAWNAAAAGASPTVTQFAGGVGGCWGTIYNDTAWGVGSSYTIGNYGMLCGNSAWKPIVCVNPASPNVTTLPALTDRLLLRSKNGYRLQVPTGALIPGVNKSTYHEMWLLDSNTVWAEDPPNSVFIISSSVTGYNITYNFAQAGYIKSTGCVTPYAFRWLARCDTYGGGSCQWSIGSNNPGGPCGIYNLQFGEDGNTAFSSAAGNAPTPNGGGTVGNAMYISVTGGYTSATVQGMKFSAMSPRTNGFVNGQFFSTGFLNGYCVFEDCIIEHNFTGVADPGPLCNFIFNGPGSFRFKNSNFTGAPASFPKFRPSAPQVSWGLGEMVFDNCSGLKLDNYIGMQGKRTESNVNLPYFYLRSCDVGQANRFENYQAVTEWNPEATVTQPLLVAKQPDGTPWSIKFDWLAAVGDSISDFNPFTILTSPQLYRDTLAIRTVTLQLMVRAALAIDSNSMVMRVSYTDSTGKVQNETTRFNAAALQASTAVWANAANFPNHVAKKYVLTTKQAVKPQTEIVVTVQATRMSPSGVAEAVFFDPEYTVA